MEELTPSVLFETGMQNLFSILALALFVLWPMAAKASIIESQRMRCPVGGEPISVHHARSLFIAEQDMDFKTYGPGLSLLHNYPECSLNGFVVFKMDFTSAEVETLRGFLRSKAFLAARNEVSSYRAYLMKRRLGGYSDAELGATLLRATWEAEGFWQYRSYAKGALFYYAREAERLRSESTPEAYHAMHIKGELSRRLMKFWDAYWAFHYQSRRPGIEGTPYKKMADYEKWAVRLLWFGALPVPSKSENYLVTLLMRLDSWWNGYGRW